MQKFSYHTHTNTFDIFDGHFSAKEMIEQAEKLGWTTIGISNHLIAYHKLKDYKCLFSDYKKAEDVFLRLIEHIREEATKHTIKVKVGFEVDYFKDVQWENWFTSVQDKLQADYYIGSTHIIPCRDRLLLLDPKNNIPPCTQEDIKSNFAFYFDTQKALIASGLFDFLAHFDVQRRYRVEDGSEFKEEKLEVIEAIKKHRIPVEINTSAFTVGLEEPHPNLWVLELLKQAQIPVILSDDAHHIDHLGRFFKQTEQLLSSMDYNFRFTMDK